MSLGGILPIVAAATLISSPTYTNGTRHEHTQPILSPPHRPRSGVLMLGLNPMLAILPPVHTHHSGQERVYAGLPVGDSSPLTYSLNTS